MMNRPLLVLLFTTLLCTCVRAQDDTPGPAPVTLPAAVWKAVDPSKTNGDRRIDVARATYFGVDKSALRTALFAAPHERDVSAKSSSVRLSLPLQGGKTGTFSIVAYDISEPAGLAKYPNIRTFYGVDVNDPTRTVYLDWTARGFHASIRGGNDETVFIDPLYRGREDLYQVYRKSDYDDDQIPSFKCMTEDTDGPEPESGNRPKSLNNCELRQYRFTTTATGEYSNYFGATSAAQSNLVQSAVVTMTNRLNQIFANDISVRFQLVANNDLLYYYDGATDPFSGSSDIQRDQNTPVVNSAIGVDNYDYGHLVHVTPGIGGISWFNAPCDPRNKARCYTSASAPDNERFWVDFVAHEIGHSFNGRHTQGNDCSRDPSGSVEPGSGSTIMSYAGICDPDVVGAVHDNFHGWTIGQMRNFIDGGGGCGTIIERELSTPVIAALPDYVIPQGTPFELSAAATGNGSITYNWEQIDREEGDAMPPVSTSARGPLFRSFSATTENSRHFPEFSATLAGTDPTWEELPETQRDMNFRLTAINANDAYGCPAWEDVTVSTHAEPEPFAVLQPNVNSVLEAGRSSQVTWSVGGTSLAPISEEFVDVYVSYDDGQTWEEQALNTANIGSTTVNFSNANSTTTARVMIRSQNSVYYAVTAPFTITGSGFDRPYRTVTNPRLITCNPPNSYTWRIKTGASAGNTQPMTFSLTAPLPSGLSASFSENPVTPGDETELTLTGISSLPPGELSFTIDITTGFGLQRATFWVNTAGDGPAAPTVNSPADGATTDLRPTIDVPVSAGTSVVVTVASDPGMNDVVYETTLNGSQPFQLPVYLQANQNYYLSSQAFDGSTTCVSSPLTMRTFSTRDDCALVTSPDAPARIDNRIDAAEMSLELAGGAITDLDVAGLQLDHTYIGDLIIDLIAPDDRVINLFNRACGGRQNIDVHFDDEAPAGNLPCPPTNGGFYRVPNGSLSQFDGMNAAGTWRLRVEDAADGDVGFLNTFALRVCAEAVLPVTWLGFTAAGRKDHIVLDWATADEVDNAGFYVDRQASGSHDWEELGFVGAAAGAGRGGEEQYAFADRTARPHTDYLYRLRQTDLDGSVSYSPVERARYGEATDGVLRIFPNPTDGHLNYRIATQRNGPLPYTLFDLGGKLLRSGLLQNNGGRLDLGGLPAGVYVLRAGGEVYRVSRL